jgi:hypothetical protein
MLSTDHAPTAQRTNRAKSSTAAQAIVKARQMFPDLSGDGVRHAGAAPQQIHTDQVETAMAFLKLLRPTKHPTTGSGSLKHHAEDWGSINGLSSYISRGAWTVAAIALGYPVRAYRYGGDVQIGVSIGDLGKVNAETLTARIERRAKSGMTLAPC